MIIYAFSSSSVSYLSYVCSSSAELLSERISSSVFLPVISDFYLRPFWYNFPRQNTNMIRHIKIQAIETCIVTSYVEMMNN